jgi:Fe-S-cluster containining protein
MGGWVPDELTTQLTGTFAAMKETECGYKPCVALKDGRCSIYHQRPSPCRDFPALIDGKVNPECTRLKNLYDR